MTTTFTEVPTNARAETYRTSTVAQECALAMAQALIQQALDSSGVHHRIIATRLRRPRMYLQKIRRGDYDNWVHFFTSRRCTEITMTTIFTEIDTHNFFGNHYSLPIATHNKYAVPNFTSPSGMADILFFRHGADTIMVNAFVGVNDLWLLDDSGAPIPPVTQPPIIPPIVQPPVVQPPVVQPPIKPPEVPPVTNPPVDSQPIPNDNNTSIYATVGDAIIFRDGTVNVGEKVTFSVSPYQWHLNGQESYSWYLDGTGNVNSIEAQPTWTYMYGQTVNIRVVLTTRPGGGTGTITRALTVIGDPIVKPPVDPIPQPLDPDLYDANGVRWSATNPPPDVEDGLDYPVVAQRYRRYQYQNPAFATITKSDVIAYRTLALPPNSVFTDRGVPELNTIGVWIRANRPTTSKEIDAWIAGGKVLA